MSCFRKMQIMVLKGPFAIVAVALGAALLGAVSLWLVERELIARTGVSLAFGAAEAAGKLDVMLQERDGVIQVLAAAPQVREADPAAIRAHLEAVQRAYPVYSRLAVVDRAGFVAASTDEGLIGLDLHQASWFQSVWHVPRVHAETISDSSRKGGTLVAVVFSAPIRGADGAFLGAVMTEVDRALWDRLVEETANQFSVQAQNFGRVSYQVLNREGALLLTSEPVDGGGNLWTAGLPSALKTTMDRSGYVEEEHPIRKVPIISGYARMSGVRSVAALQWRVLVRADLADVLASARNALVNGAMGFALMLALIAWGKRSQQREVENVAQAQRLLRDRDAQLSAAVTSAVDGIISIDRTGRILSFNPAAKQLFGYSVDEVMGRNVSMLMAEPYMSEHDGYLQRFLQTGVARVIGLGREVTGRRRDGSIFPMDLAVSEMMLGEQRCFMGIVRDITERKQMVEQLKERETFYRLLSEHLPIGVFEIDYRGACLYVNRAWQSLFNLSEAAGGSSSIKPEPWVLWFHPDDREKVEEEWERARTTFDRVAVECRLAECGEEARWVNVLLWPMTTEEGVRYLGTLEDITERKRTVARTMTLLRHGRFELQTLTEARNLAELLAYAFPDPSRTQLGLTELLVNGVEHGNLDISYAEKSALLDQGQFEAELIRRLALPEHTNKRVHITVERTDRDLEMTILDAGSGFDWKPYLDLNRERTGDLHGRGIAMAKLISFDDVEFRGCGNQVVVSVSLKGIDADAGPEEERKVA